MKPVRVCDAGRVHLRRRRSAWPSSNQEPKRHRPPSPPGRRPRRRLPPSPTLTRPSASSARLSSASAARTPPRGRGPHRQGARLPRPRGQPPLLPPQERLIRRRRTRHARQRNRSDPPGREADGPIAVYRGYLPGLPVQAGVGCIAAAQTVVPAGSLRLTPLGGEVLDQEQSVSLGCVQLALYDGGAAEPSSMISTDDGAASSRWRKCVKEISLLKSRMGFHRGDSAVSYWPSGRGGVCRFHSGVRMGSHPGSPRTS